MLLDPGRFELFEFLDFKDMLRSRCQSAADDCHDLRRARKVGCLEKTTCKVSKRSDTFEKIGIALIEI